MPDPRKNLIRGRVRAFASCGTSAQKLLLENGAWTQLDSWFRTGVTNKDAKLLKMVLEVVLSMPTSWSDLQKHSGGLPLSVETLLKSVAHGQLKDWEDQKEVTILKGLMLDVFVKWLKIKKVKWEEPEDNQRLVVEVKDTGEKGAIALIEGRPGWGFLMVGGKIKVLEVMEEVDDGHGHEVENGTRNKVAKLTEKSRGDNLLEEMINPLPVTPSKVEEEEEPQKMEVDKDKEVDLMEDVLDEATCKVLDNLRIEEDLGVPKKLVRWWGVDGVKEILEYPGGDYSREGYEKEKWVSIEFEDEEDEDEVDNGHGGRWNLRKIHFDKIPGFINLEVNSTEVEVQRRRELEVKRWVEEVGGGRDTPFEEDVDKEGDEEDDSSDIFKIVEEVTTEDVIEGMETDTLVFDRRLEVWPEPKKAKRFLGGGGGFGRRWGKERRFKVLNQNGNNVNGKMNGGK